MQEDFFEDEEDSKATGKDKVGDGDGKTKEKSIITLTA